MTEREFVDRYLNQKVRVNNHSSVRYKPLIGMIGVVASYWVDGDAGPYVDVRFDIGPRGAMNDHRILKVGALEPLELKVEPALLPE